MHTGLNFVFAAFLLNYADCEFEGYCPADSGDCEFSNGPKTRYVFYDINPPEGFNLRRDVYMRYAVFAHRWRNDEKMKNYKLVLPPWSYLYHWKHSETPEYMPWGLFFDVDSLKRFAPVVEMHEFFKDYPILYPPIKIDHVFILQHFKDMFETGNFEDRMAIEPCQSEIRTNFYYFHNVTSDNIDCLSFHGHTSQLGSVLDDFAGSTIMFDHAEVALHELFGDATYWKARRSMRFNKELVKIAEDYRKKFLDSNDINDGTERPVKWENEKPKRSAKGGPYLSVHLRRRDFVYARRKEIPTLKKAAEQIKSLLKKLQLTKVFVATDAPESEFTELKLLISENSRNAYEILRYKPNTSVKSKYKDGGIAVIDQIICAHAKYFVGSFESTFSFRIQEEREIIGFPYESTFNRLCGDESDECKRPSVWKIVY